MKMTKSGLKKKIQEVSYQEHLITTKQEIKLEKSEKKYVKEEGSYKNRKICQELRLARERHMVHEMFNVPMNEQCLVWFID